MNGIGGGGGISTTSKTDNRLTLSFTLLLVLQSLRYHGLQELRVDFEQ